MVDRGLASAALVFITTAIASNAAGMRPLGWLIQGLIGAVAGYVLSSPNKFQAALVVGPLIGVYEVYFWRIHLDAVLDGYLFFLDSSIAIFEYGMLIGFGCVLGEIMSTPFEFGSDYASRRQDFVRRAKDHSSKGFDIRYPQNFWSLIPWILHLFFITMRYVIRNMSVGRKLMLSMLAALLPMFIFGVQWPNGSERIWQIYIWILVGPAGFLAGGAAALFFAPLFSFFTSVWTQMKLLGVPFANIAAGYLITVILYAILYTSIYHLDPSSFQYDPVRNAVPPAAVAFEVYGSHWVLSFGDFLYFSITTITTVGLSDVKPAIGRRLTELVVSSELLLGLFWLVIYVSALAQALNLLRGQGAKS